MAKESDDRIDFPPIEGGTVRVPPARDHVRRSKEDASPVRSYYDVPMLKPPVWKWEIASYFFLGGLSGGAYAIARAAGRFGGKDFADIRRLGSYVAFSAFLPCAPLLIVDLGDRTRFHYMLRVFKPKSPMNFGAWILSAFGGILSLVVLKEWLFSRKSSQRGKHMNAAGAGIDLIGDIAGVPLALLLAGYTGVLLSTSATPIWTRNRWLGPLFSASALSTGAAAITLAAAAASGRRRRAERPLQRFEAIARAAEAVALGGFLVEGGNFTKPVTHGRYARHLWGGAVGLGLVLPSLLAALPARSATSGRWLRIGAAAAVLAGGFALRWAITLGGHPSGNDPQATRDSSRK